MLMKGREYEVASFQVMELVASSECSAYDCEFVALAEDLGIPFVTADKKISKHFRKFLYHLTTMWISKHKGRHLTPKLMDLVMNSESVYAPLWRSQRC